MVEALSKNSLAHRPEVQNPSSSRKAKQKADFTNPSMIPEAVISRFFNTPRGFTQDEITSLKPELGDHIVGHIRAVQDGTETVIQVDEELPTVNWDINRKASSVGLLGVQAVFDFFEAQRLDEKQKGQVSPQPMPSLGNVNMVGPPSFKGLTVAELNSTIDELLDKCTANVNLLPVRFGGPESRPFPENSSRV